MIGTNTSFPIGVVGDAATGFVLASMTVSSSGATLVVSASNAFPLAASSTEIADDIAEGLKALKEPTVATWSDVKAQLGL